MYSNNIVNFQESILNACIKKFGNLLNSPHTYIYMNRYKISSKDLELVSPRVAFRVPVSLYS